jgi:hypothetical protein
MNFYSASIARNFKSVWTGNSRTARHYQARTIDPEITRQALLNNFRALQGDFSVEGSSRSGKYEYIYLFLLIFLFIEFHPFYILILIYKYQ